jgi:NAD+ synthase (glutamine-hydrolysing)
MISAETLTNEYEPRLDYIRVATATPEVSLANVANNIAAISGLYRESVEQQAAIVVFPELSITGYSVGDLVQSPTLLNQAKEGLLEHSELTKAMPTAMVVGLPLAVNNEIYNCAALISDGEIRGIVPKQNLPTYKEFYEKRWYQSWGEQPNIALSIGDNVTTFGTNQLFSVAGSIVGIEICEDLWVPQPPHEKLIANGADIILNPSASPEIASKSSYRRQLVGITAAKQVAGYVYSGADHTESTMDVVMSGHALISESGKLLAERAPFDNSSPRLTYADIDRSHLLFDRRQNTNFPNLHTINPTSTTIEARQTDLLTTIDPHPFIPKGTPEQIKERLAEILTIQATGLAQRVASVGGEGMVLGLSGGLDSTLALLVAVKAARQLGRSPNELIHTLTMPSKASSKRTQGNAIALSRSLDIPSIEIPIGELANQQLNALNHAGDEDVTFENTQARIRTALLFNYANQHRRIVVGTGDLSEIALGWSTFNGDHMSHYNPNASVPKSLIRALVEYASNDLPADARSYVRDILDTPVSPELTGTGDLSQSTESILGPYELHDFFEYHFVRWMEPVDKIEYLALKAHGDKYKPAEIRAALSIYIERFFKNQWKRSVMPDGPKVGTVSHSPRGDWRMPSDARDAHLAFYARLGMMDS